MTFIPAIITAEVLEHADGRPVAYIDATASRRVRLPAA